MEARYLTDDKGNRLGILLDIKEQERLREIEDEMEDIRRYDEPVSARERGESDAVPWGGSQARDRGGAGRTQAAR